MRPIAPILLAFAAVSLGCHRQPPRRPDILVIVIDALRADHLGCYGYQRPTSPSIDAFASRGLVFDDAIATASWTKPSIPSLLTGLYPSQHGVFSGSHEDTEGAIDSDILDDRHETIAEALSASGYRTAAFVENAQLKSFLGFGQGFDRYVDGAGSASEIVAKFLAWANADRERPFFAYLHLLDVHWPYQPEPPFDTRFGNTGSALDLGSAEWRSLRDEINDGKRIPTSADVARMIELYDGEVAMTDAALAGLLHALDDTALGGNCFVLLTADHGEEFYEHRKIGHGHSLSDTLLRIPLVCRAPFVVAGRTRQPVSMVDVYPTLLEIAGRTPSADLPGTNLLAPAEHRAARTLIAETRPGNDHVLAARRYPHKLVRTYRVAKSQGHGFDLRDVLATGMRVEADLDVSTDPWQVTRLTIKRDQTETGIEARGRLASLGPQSLSVLHLDARLDDRSKILDGSGERASTAILAAGAVVEIDGDFVQDRFVIRHAKPAKPDETWAQIEAPIEQWSKATGRLTLARRELELPAAAVLKDRREKVPGEDPREATSYRARYEPRRLLAREQLEVQEQLFDLAGDPGESNDVRAELPAIADELRRELDRYLERCARDFTASRTRTLDPGTIDELRRIGYVK